MRTGQNCARLFVTCALAAVGAAQAQTATETVIYSFAQFPQGADPYSPLTLDAEGNIYGTTYVGGQSNAGVVFMLTASGQETVLHSFTGGKDGGNPYAGVVLSSSGSLYGTTYVGGTANAGVVYTVTAAGQFKALYSFTGGADGGNPYAGVVADSSGNLYGTTVNGGSADAGVVYKVTPSGQESVLYSFTGRADGKNPYGALIFDPEGNLYGTTHAGGNHKDGVLFELSPAGQETVLYSFDGAGGNAGDPMAGVTRDAAGNLYGTGSEGVYKFDTATGQFTELGHLGCETGGESTATVVLDSAGNIYGVTNTQEPGCGPPNGAVFKLDTSGQFTALFAFPGATRPDTDELTGPSAGVVFDAAGNLYGATSYGGVSGMVYKISPAGEETKLYSFQGAPGGTEPFSQLIQDQKGNLYGMTLKGGTANEGVLYELDTAGKEKTLHTFPDSVGAQLARDSKGNLYGDAGDKTTGFGEIFGLSPSGNYTVLYNFTGEADGDGSGGVVLGPDGDLYGVADLGAAGCGLVFRLTLAGGFTILHTFIGSDGCEPNNGLVFDPAGNMYGTTNEGGLGAGVIYEITSAGGFSVLYTFSGAADGGNPMAGVVIDASGNLYGTAVNYGKGFGVVFKLDAAGSYSVLYAFSGGLAGSSPPSGVVLDAAGNLYGTTIGGGMPGCGVSGCGVVYMVSPSGQESVLYSFTGGADGASPYGAGLIFDIQGNLVGTTPFGGKGGSATSQFSGAGVLFKVILQ